MNSASSAAAPPPLLFQWDSQKGRRLSIAMFLILSIIAHAFCFYVFQIVYPPTVTLLPPPARVSLITADSEEGRSLLRWIEAEDPALAFATHRPPEARSRALPKVGHIPSYLTKDPILKEAPPLVVDLRPPSANPPGPVPRPHHFAPPPAGPIGTATSFSEEFNALGSPNLPATTFTASNNEPARSTRFRVAASKRGEIRHCFLLESSGDPVLDEQARNYLMVCRFAGGGSDSLIENGLIWGIATIDWGNDVLRPQGPSPKNSP